MLEISLLEKYLKEIGNVLNVRKKSLNFLLNQLLIAPFIVAIAGNRKELKDLAKALINKALLI